MDLSRIDRNKYQLFGKKLSFVFWVNTPEQSVRMRTGKVVERWATSQRVARSGIPFPVTMIIEYFSRIPFCFRCENILSFSTTKTIVASTSKVRLERSW